MEFISRSFDSDEGVVDLLISDQDEYNSGDFVEDHETLLLEAKVIYLLLPKNVPISRASRLQWFLDHINTTVTLPDVQNLDNTSEDIEILSILPREQIDTRCYRFLINNRTELYFLSHQYRIVYCFDMSPSQSVVDIEKGEIMFDEMLIAFRFSIESLIKQFIIPGSSLTFQPKIFITVMANTPFYLSPAQQILVKGVQINQDNLDEVTKFIRKQFCLLETKLADVTRIIQNQTREEDIDKDKNLNDNNDLSSEKLSTIIVKTPMVSPDTNFVNMLRYSMLAISLLPDISFSHIIVVTDGVVAMPDSNIMESLLYQLHYDNIAVSFFKIGSLCNPYSNAGYIAYSDLLYFLSNSTSGICLRANEIKINNISIMNYYHELFLLWSFHANSNHGNYCLNDWNFASKIFSNYRSPILLTKRQTEENTSASLYLLLSKRMREGFVFNYANYTNGIMRMQLTLSWKTSINIHYKISTQWPIIKNNLHIEIFISAPYEFLHDITCVLKKDNKSLYRLAVIERFWLRLSQLSTEMIFAQQLTSIQNSTLWYTLPESIRSRIPVFVLNNTIETTKLILTPSVTSSKFMNAWQPICQMETNKWRKWFHTHKISLILKHDNPLPKHLHLANSSQRYQVVQCRQAATALYGMLSVWSSFVLIDNHTYAKLISHESEKPSWFCIIRITSKLPCAVINIAFLTGTPGIVRRDICNQIKKELTTLSYMPSPGKIKENICCVILQKPLEKILIRYDRMPNDFSTVIFPDGTQPSATIISNTVQSSSLIIGSLFTTLSRYLFHKRWIWSATHTNYPRLPESAVSRILSTLTRMRMKEGFNFAHSSSGIITMVIELWMDYHSSCVVQYVLFAPHRAWWGDDICSGSEDDNDDFELDSELQMVTEVWIEPQYGKVQSKNSKISYLNHRHYYELADMIYETDLKCIATLLTMEHLSLMCQEKNANNIETCMSFTRFTSAINCRHPIKYLDLCSTDVDRSHPITTPRIEHIPFKFDLINILPLCHQTELLYSMFTECLNENQINNDCDKSNKLLLDSIIDHLILLNDHELTLTKDDSKRFTMQIITRNKNLNLNIYQSNIFGNCLNPNTFNSQWRCFIKGISITHVILTFLPINLNDIKHSSMTYNLNNNTNESNINLINSLILPIYVFDCPLALLVGAYVNTTDDNNNINKDLYEDNRFKNINNLHEEILRLKNDINLHNNNSFNDIRNDDNEVPDNKRNLKLHCKTLSLVHSKCFTISLFTALHNNLFVHNIDVQSAMEQCRESSTGIDITEYIMTVCGHVKFNDEDKIDFDKLLKEDSCKFLRPLHKLIQEKFFKNINISFNPIPTHSEFYFCKCFSNTTNITPNEILNGIDKIKNNKKLEKLEKLENIIIDNNNEKNLDIASNIVEPVSGDVISVDIPPASTSSVSSQQSKQSVKLLQCKENGNNEILTNNINPLFLNFICKLHYNNEEIEKIPVRVIPTCLADLIKNIEIDKNTIEKKKFQVILDILCLTLPSDIQQIITEYSSQGLRTTSFCSDSFQFNNETIIPNVNVPVKVTEPLNDIQDYQKTFITILHDEIKWLLKDEIATALLDIDIVTSTTLNSIIKHITESKERSSCHLDIISLNFVYGATNSYDKFVEEFVKIKIPNFKLYKENDLYYLAKDYPLAEAKIRNNDDSDELIKKDKFNDLNDQIYDLKFLYSSTNTNDESSDINSTINNNNTDSDKNNLISDDECNYDWLVTLNNQRSTLPNFWIIMKTDMESVTVYFHCRFLELKSLHVTEYLNIEKNIKNEISELCKKVNQFLLLHSLYETRICNSLLEPDDSKDWPLNNSPILRNSSYMKFRHIDDNDDYDMMSSASTIALSEASLNFKSGYFSCPVVWETHFILHPRLKSGAGKSGISRGILALKNILDKFSVSNRNNMFVYRDIRSNVFYLRLHENVSNSCNKPSVLRPNEFESAIVSRSPSIASLPLGQNKTKNEPVVSSITSNDIRPRVRSFGEKESKDGPSEDTLILKVHGITEAGTDVQCDLVQVLQNRLDDAVLEFLSVMLARNSMCPLTPEDVHFIQKPFRLPEIVIKLTMQDFLLEWLDALMHYLRQNLIQFLNIPRYSDSRSHYHFKDFSESEQAVSRNNEDNIFIYNQSQNPSSGSRGIACIAFAVVFNSDNNKFTNDFQNRFDDVFQTKSYQDIVTSLIINNHVDTPNVHLEFRLWKQGRVNVDNLSLKLKEAISQATWDVVMEYYLLKEPLCIEKKMKPKVKPIDIKTIDLNKENEFHIIIDIKKENIHKLMKRKLEPLFISRKRNNRPINPINPPMSKTKRSITFDDYEREKENYQSKIINSKPLTKLNNYETGDDGILNRIYSKYLPEWLEFGANLNVPSVKKHKITLTNHHLPCKTIKELMNIIKEAPPKAFSGLPIDALTNENIYVPYDMNPFAQECIIILRNFDNWKASTAFNGPLDFPDFMSPHALKNSQKFVPTVINNNFIPRQKILWILIKSDSLLIYTYNWARDSIEKLVNECTKLGQWLSVRSCFLNSVTAQKLGLFHNQAITQKHFLASNNPYTYVIGSASHINEFPREEVRKILSNTPNIPSILEVFRDCFNSTRYITDDPVMELAMEMIGMKNIEKKSLDEMKKLHAMYQSRTSTTTVTQILFLIQNARIIHYCHTPLLFLPNWRLKTASTRDNSIYSFQSAKALKQSNCWEKETWHSDLCYGFFCDYRRYLQTLGFMPLQIESTNRKSGIWSKDNSSYNSVFYIQKTILGGILIFTVEFNEPFFKTILYAIECNRLQKITSRASINRFTLSFLDECDRVKILMHLHSFTYDYHLRCIYNYISNVSGFNKVCERYNVNQFLDDFIKYYTKAPNFARNLIHADTITIKNLLTEGKQLFDYLLMNVAQYDFKILDMNKGDGEMEYILIQVTSTPQVSYRDAQDRQRTDDFEITLIVYNLCNPYLPTDHVLHIKYYLILTSKSDIFPKSEIEQKLGKFCSVSSATRDLTLERNHHYFNDNKYDCNSSDEYFTFKITDLEESTQSTSLLAPPSTTSSSSLSTTTTTAPPTTPAINTTTQISTAIPLTPIIQIEISQESVNYMGYYSSHEQLMQQIIMDKAKSTQIHIREMVAKGMVHCRTHLLWNKLISPQESYPLNYEEFLELKNLAELEHLCDLYPNLGPILNKPLSWYQGLAKLLLVKYNDQNRMFTSPDGNIQHYVILHPRYFGAFMLLSMDLHTERGELFAVNREPHNPKDTHYITAYKNDLLDGFVNCICFYLWYGMI